MMDGGQTPRAEPVSSTLSQNTASLGELSNETIQHIMGYLDGGDLQSLASTSSRMRANALAVSPPLGIARPVMVAPGVPFTADTIFDASFILNPEGINISRQQIRWLQRVIMGEERGVMPMRVLHDELPTTVSERAREAGYTAEQISICRFPIDNLRRYMMAHFYTSQMEVYGGVYIGNDAEMDARYAAFLNSKGYPLHY
ncbi:hypothetical protein HQN64_23835 [Enterobacteriaceae bacterium BIT-l23]|nr:hypothetical protein [Enterobacteriaceae bacterium BIT-l23]